MKGAINMQQLKFDFGDTVYFFAAENQESFVAGFDLVPVEYDPYEKLIREAKVNAIHIYQNRPAKYDTRSSEGKWVDVFEDCLYGSYDEAKVALQELLAKRINELTVCYLN